MKQENLSPTKVQTIQLSILKRFADFCESREINYLLCGGSMLGAIRHQGFIPWDDDIDIMMPRPDYNRFIKELEDPYLKIFHYATHQNYDYPYIKLGDNRTYLYEDFYYKKIDLGIHIDIFPIDGLPEDEQVGLEQFGKMLKFRKKFLFKIFKLSSSLAIHKRMVVNLLRSFIPIKKLLNNQEELALKYDFETSPKAGKLVWGSGKNQIYLKTLFTETEKFPFEGFQFKGPKDYDTYLKSIYGDYMQLPPKDKQVSHHHFDCGIKESFTLEDILTALKSR